MTITYRPKGVCSRLMRVEVEDGIIRQVEVQGGCSGNLQGISRLLVGMPVQQAIERMEGVRCGGKPTSCPDQLAKALLTIAGFSLQPSELIKVAFIYVGATSLNRMFRSKSILLFIAFSAICVGGLALMGDFGSALIFFATFLVIAFMRSGSIATVLLAVTSAAMAGTLVLSIKPHVAQRFATWGHVWEDVSGAGYQQTRALSAAASGGLFGQGAGCGWLKNIFAANTDMVFGMLCEELGLIVALCAMLAIIALAIFTVKNAAQGRSSYYVIAGCATVTLMLVQMSLNVFGALDILPFTGVTFPFVSKGGSSMLSCWMLLAYIKAADTRRGASFVVRLPSRKNKEAQA